MPLGATSSDKALDHPSTPILKLLDRNKPGTGVLTETDEILMIRPQFLSFISGRTSFDKRIDDIIVRLNAFNQSSSFNDSYIDSKLHQDNTFLKKNNSSTDLNYHSIIGESPPIQSTSTFSYYYNKIFKSNK